MTTLSENHWLWIRRSFCGALVVVSLLLGARWLGVVWEQLNTPWDVGYESTNLCSILLIQRHLNIYAESTYNADPFVFTTYTPLYHYLVSLFPIRETNPFFYGRIVALAGFVGLAGLIVLRSRHSLIGLCLAVGYLSTWTASCDSTVVRVDSLGILLGVSGMLLMTYSRSWPAISLAALLAVAAVATKQNFVAPTLAAGVFLCANDRRAFLKYCAAVGLWAALGAAFASLYFGGGFWFSVIQGVRQPYSLAAGLTVIKSVLVQPLSDVLVLAAVLIVCRRVHVDGLRRTLQFSPSSVFFVMAMLIFFATIWKMGSARNYANEPMWASCLVLADALSTSNLRQRFASFTVVAGTLCLAGVFDLLFAPPGAYHSVRAMPPQAISEYQLIIRQTGIEHPRVLNTVMPLFIFSVGLEPTFNDSALYHSLYWRKLLSPEPLVDAVTREVYDVIVLPDSTATWAIGSFLQPRFCAAVREHYRHFTSIPRLHFSFYVRARE